MLLCFLFAATDYKQRKQKHGLFSLKSLIYGRLTFFNNFVTLLLWMNVICFWKEKGFA